MAARSILCICGFTETIHDLAERPDEVCGAFQPDLVDAQFRFKQLVGNFKVEDEEQRSRYHYFTGILKKKNLAIEAKIQNYFNGRSGQSSGYNSSNVSSTSRGSDGPSLPNPRPQRQSAKSKNSNMQRK